MEVQCQSFAAFCREEGITCLEGAPMKEYTSFHIGGPAAVLAKPAGTIQISRVMRYCNQNGLEPLIIGNGSDLLVSDAGIKRPVVQIGPELADMRLWVGGVCCTAGVSLAALCVFAQRNSLTGLEFAYGIPGNVGGAVFMNAGAYGGEMKDVVERVTFVTKNGEIQTVSGPECEFSYRHSIFTENSGCITEVCFRLQPGDGAAIRARMDELMARRKEKQPLEYPSAGSTFKRPVGGYASELIDRCGLKGLRVGGAMVSEKHAGFLINYDNATCADVLALVKCVQDAVKAQTGFALECEMKYVE